MKSFLLLRRLLALFLIAFLSFSPLFSLINPNQAQAAVRQLAPSSNGVSVGSNADGNVIDISNIVSDGSGGFYIAWSDTRDGDGSHPYSIYVQRFDEDGDALNGNGGTKVANVVELDEDGDLVPDLVASDSGDVIVTWRDDQDSEPGADLGRMYTQAIDTSGDILIPELISGKLDLVEGSNNTFSDSNITDSSTTISHTVAGSNRFLIVSVTFERGAPQFGYVDDITYGGASLSVICGNDNNFDTTSSGDEVVHELWYMNNPDTGTDDLVVDWGAEINDAYIEVTTLNNVDTDSPIDDINCYNSDDAGATTDGSVGTMIAENAVGDSDYTVRKGLYASIASSNENGNVLTPSFDLDEEWNTTVGDLVTAGGTKPSDEDSVNEDTEYGWRGTRLEAFAMGAVVLNTVDGTTQDTPTYTGTQLWGNTDLDGDYWHETLTDGSGGQVNFSVNGSKVRGQRIDDRGIRLWGNDGTEINVNGGSTNAGTSFDFDYDGTNYYGGWGNRDGANNLVAQKINSSGAIQWNSGDSPDAVIIDTTGSYDRRYPLGVAHDGAGGMMMLFARAPISTGTIDLRVQHIDSDGDLQFGSGGIALHSFDSGDSFPYSFGKLIRDDDGNYIAMWTREDGRVYAQKFDQDGDALWDDSDSDGGVRLGNAQTWGNLDLISDGQGGAFAAILDTSSNEMVIQGVFENGELLYSDFYTVSEDTASGTPQLYNIDDGEAVIAWEEDRDGNGNNVFFMRIENLYQIRNLNNLTPQDSGGTDIAFDTNNGVKDTDEDITVVDDDNDFPISTINSNMTIDRDWDDVEGDTDTTNSKAFVSNLTDAPGTDATHTLYVPYNAEHASVTICPDATSLAQVSTDCTGAITKTDADSDTSITTVNGKQVWAITGLTGTGGIGVSAGTSELSFPGDGSIKLINYGGFENNPKPTLKFKKAVLEEGSVSSYRVTLDSGKNRSFSVSGIPASGDGSDNYVWKDDDEVRVSFHNEDDSNPDNDEIHVFFKELSDEPLTEGKHNWGVRVTNDSDASDEVRRTFFLDLTPAMISNFSLAGEQSGLGVTYDLTSSQRTPSFAGRVYDVYAGSTRTNENGSKDTFDEVSGGPRALRANVSRVVAGTTESTFVYQHYFSKEVFIESETDVDGVEKWANFYMVPDVALQDGSYKVELVLTDQAGNRTLGSLFLNVGTPYPFFQSVFGPPTSQQLESDLLDLDQVPVDTIEEAQEVSIEGSLVTVTVLDSMFRPVPGAGVTILETLHTATTNENGQAVFEGLVAGTYTLEIAYDDQITTQTFSVENNMREVNVSIRLSQVVGTPVIGQVAGATIAVAGVVALVAPIAAVAATIIPALSSVAVASQMGGSLPFTVTTKIFSKVLQSLGILPVGSPQGILFNSETFKPIPFAIITIVNQDPELAGTVSTVVSDVNGVYSGVKLSPGSYKIVVSHQDFDFPTKRNRPSYLSIKDFYLGEVFSIRTEKQKQLFTIPLSPKIKDVQKYFKNRLRLMMSSLSRLSQMLILPFFFLTGLIAFFYPTLLNIVIFAVYAIMASRKVIKSVKSPVIEGQVTDQSGNPLKNAVIKVVNARNNDLIAILTTDKSGEFSAFGPKTLYRLEVNLPGYVWKGQGAMSFSQIDARKKAQQLDVEMQSTDEIYKELFS